ncbi:hypothetical protein P171DRAFT_523788 [Karstenula rhodostoma CBS 690.94]|uniref:Uncharacterized protein n=1 Tax=Karstenula rhodostoma CBS 690.94 TaxID=1392251 RepID=A0A9P4U9D2_9PLEO|nr:hypothetical protein P171DRAFT_523788 [Karstenula rhodostoma CBS 690.94]
MDHLENAYDLAGKLGLSQSHYSTPRGPHIAFGAQHPPRRIPPHVRSLNVREDRGGVYICLYQNWGPPCIYHRPSFFPNYPLCWTSRGLLGKEPPLTPIGSIGLNVDTACFGFKGETNTNCTPRMQGVDKKWDMMRFPGIWGDKTSNTYWSVKCVWDDGKLEGYNGLWNATNATFEQYAPKPRGGRRVGDERGWFTAE